MTDRPRMVVLGASGFLGSAVISRIDPTSAHVVAVGRKHMPAQHAGTRGRQVDVSHPDALADVVHGADVVINLLGRRHPAGSWRVGEDDVAAQEINQDIVERLITTLSEAAQQPPPVVVQVGSTSQASASPTAYERQKQRAENALADAASRGGVRAVALRLGTVFGHRGADCARDRGVVASVTRRALSGQPLHLWFHGEPRRDLISVDDAARAILTAASHASNLARGPWDVGTGEATTMRALFERIAAQVGRTTGCHVPVLEIDPPAHASASDASDFIPDPDPFQLRTGWRPTRSWTQLLDEIVQGHLQTRHRWPTASPEEATRLVRRPKEQI